MIITVYCNIYLHILYELVICTFIIFVYRLYGEDRAVNISLNLREHFNRPNTIEKPGHLDGLIRGLATQQSQKMDMDIVQDVSGSK